MKKENKKVFAKIMVMVMALSLISANGSVAFAGDGDCYTDMEETATASGNASAEIEEEETISLEERMPEAVVCVSGLPTGSSIVVKTIREVFGAEAEKAMKEKIASEADTSSDNVIVYDIIILDAEGNEWQPSDRDEVHVQFILDDKTAETGNAYWVSDDAEQIEVMETVETGDAAVVDMVATHFSSFGITTSTTGNENTDSSTWKPLKIFIRETRSGKYTRIGELKYPAISNAYVSNGETKTYDFTYYPDAADQEKNEKYNVSGFYYNRAEMKEADTRIREIISGVYGEDAMSILDTLDDSGETKYVCAKMSNQLNAVHVDVVLRDFSKYEKVWFRGYLIKKNSNGTKWSNAICEGYFKEGLAPRINKESENDNQQVENTIDQFVFEGKYAQYEDPVNMFAAADYYYTSDTVERYGIHADWVKANLCGTSEWHADGKVVGANDENYDNKTIVVFDLVKDGETTRLGDVVIDKDHVLAAEEISEDIVKQTVVEGYTEPVWTVDGDAYVPGEKAFTMQVGGKTVAADEKHVTITINKIEEAQSNDNTDNTGAAGENTGAAGENTGAAGENIGATGENTGAVGENTGAADGTTPNPEGNEPEVEESQIIGGIVPGMTDGLGQIINDVQEDMSGETQDSTETAATIPSVPYVSSIMTDEEPETIFVAQVGEAQEETQPTSVDKLQEAAADWEDDVEDLWDEDIVPLDESAKRKDNAENRIVADRKERKPGKVVNSNVELTIIRGEKVAKSDRADVAESKETVEIKNWAGGATTVAEELDDFVRRTVPAAGALPLGLVGVAVLGAAGFARISLIGKRR